MSLGNFLWKEAKMPITGTRWWGDVLSGKKPFALQSHNAIHADATKELGNNWATRNPDATAAMVLATIFSGGAASGAAGGAGGGAAAGGAAAGGAAAGGSAAAGSTAAGGASYGLAASGAEAGAGLTAGGAGATGSGLMTTAGGETYALGSTTGTSGNGLLATGADGTVVAGESPGFFARAGQGLKTAGSYANTGLKAAATAQQAKGLLTPTGTPPAQAAPVQNKPADFSGLLKQYASDDKWSQQYAQYVQGLLGGYRG
mgnify:CR=1 FL=1